MNKPSANEVEHEAIDYALRLAKNDYSKTTNYVTCYLAGYTDALEEQMKIGYEGLQAALREKLRRRARGDQVK